MSNNEQLSPDKSPSILSGSGVKRVNNIPLIIAISVLTLFSLLIALVAVKRANNQSESKALPAIKTLKKDSLMLAQEVIGNHRPKVPSAVDTLNEKTFLAQPVAKSRPVVAIMDDKSLPKDIMQETGASDAEIERIRQEKTQAFEEAVKAGTTVRVNKERVSVKQNSSSSFEAGMTGTNPAVTFKEQLALLQAARQSRPTIGSIGGEENEDRWRLKSTVQSPSSRFELRAGAVIPGVMVSGIRSELPGQIIGQVSQNVYDTATGRYLLIPQGTKLVGVYSSNVSFGQDSVLIAWQRLIFPDGKALDIGSMPGGDSAGYGGFRDKVNHHYVRIYGSALLMSGIVAGITYSQSRNQTDTNGYRPPSAGDVLSQALGQQLGEVTANLVAKNLNTAPTITVRPGYRFNVIVVKDLVFKSPYQQFAY